MFMTMLRLISYVASSHVTRNASDSQKETPTPAILGYHCTNSLKDPSFLKLDLFISRWVHESNVDNQKYKIFEKIIQNNLDRDKIKTIISYFNQFRYSKADDFYDISSILARLNECSHNDEIKPYVEFLHKLLESLDSIIKLESPDSFGISDYLFASLNFNLCKLVDLLGDEDNKAQRYEIKSLIEFKDFLSSIISTKQSHNDRTLACPHSLTDLVESFLNLKITLDYCLKGIKEIALYEETKIIQREITRIVEIYFLLNSISESLATNFIGNNDRKTILSSSAIKCSKLKEDINLISFHLIKIAFSDLFSKDNSIEAKIDIRHHAMLESEFESVSCTEFQSPQNKRKNLRDEIIESNLEHNGYDNSDFVSRYFLSPPNNYSYDCNARQESEISEGKGINFKIHLEQDSKNYNEYINHVDSKEEKDKNLQEQTFTINTLQFEAKDTDAISAQRNIFPTTEDQIDIDAEIFSTMDSDYEFVYYSDDIEVPGHIIFESSEDSDNQNPTHNLVSDTISNGSSLEKKEDNQSSLVSETVNLELCISQLENLEDQGIEKRDEHKEQDLIDDAMGNVFTVLLDDKAIILLETDEKSIPIGTDEKSTLIGTDDKPSLIDMDDLSNEDSLPFQDDSNRKRSKTENNKLLENKIFSYEREVQNVISNQNDNSFLSEHGLSKNSHSGQIQDQGGNCSKYSASNFDDEFEGDTLNIDDIFPDSFEHLTPIHSRNVSSSNKFDLKPISSSGSNISLDSNSNSLNSSFAFNPNTPRSTSILNSFFSSRRTHKSTNLSNKLRPCDSENLKLQKELKDLNFYNSLKSLRRKFAKKIKRASIAHDITIKSLQESLKKEQSLLSILKSKFAADSKNMVISKKEYRSLNSKCMNESSKIYNNIESLKLKIKCENEAFHKLVINLKLSYNKHASNLNDKHNSKI